MLRLRQNMILDMLKPMLKQNMILDMLKLMLRLMLKLRWLHTLITLSCICIACEILMLPNVQA